MSVNTTKHINKKSILTKFNILLLILVIYIGTSQAKLPDLGASDLIVYDNKTEQKLGREFSTALHKQYNLIKDPETLSIIRNIGNKIAQQILLPRNFSFEVIDSQEINAFAGPNGIIGVNTGLIMNVKTEGELASVIAHEIAHITQRHLSRTLETQPKATMSSLATILAAILVGTQDVNAGIATLMTGIGINLQNRLKHSRIYETEADNIGIKYLYDAGYNPKAMVNAFSVIAQAYPTDGLNTHAFLRTHPITKIRMAKAMDRASSFKPHKNKKSNELLNILKIRLYLLSKDRFNIKLKLSKHEQCYKKNMEVITKLQVNKNNLDMVCLKRAIKSNTQQYLYRLLYAQINTQLKKTEALKTLSLLNDLYPNNLAIILHRAKALNKFKNKDSAIKYLQDKVIFLKKPYLIFKELSKLMSKKHKKHYSLYYKALTSKSIGNLVHYKYLLKSSKKLAKKRKDKQLLKKINLELSLHKL